MDWLDRLAVQGTLKSLLQYHSSKASIPQCSVFLMVQLSHLYVTIGKTIDLTRQTFVGKVMSLFFNMLSRLVITFLPKSKCLLISWVALVVKNLPANAGDIKDVSSIPVSGRSPGEGSGNPLQYSCLENPMDRGAWQAIQSMGLQRVRHG